MNLILFYRWYLNSIDFKSMATHQDEKGVEKSNEEHIAKENCFESFQFVSQHA